jgi:hypothetical protein
MKPGDRVIVMVHGEKMPGRPYSERKGTVVKFSAWDDVIVQPDSYRGHFASIKERNPWQVDRRYVRLLTPIEELADIK